MAPVRSCNRGRSLSTLTAFRLSCLALGISILALGLHAWVQYWHAPFALPPRILTLVGVAGLTWPLWAYAAAMYHRALATAK